MRLPALLFALTLPLSAHGLDDLRAALRRLPGGDPVKASVEHSFWRQTTDDKKPTVSQGRVSAQVEEGPQGLKVAWPRPLLQQAAQELAAQEQNPEAQAPTRLGLRNLDALELAESLNAAPALLRDLDQAQLQEERSEPWQGRPARLLVLKVTPRLPAGQKKYLKDLKVEAKVWVGADGLPLAYATSVAYRGSRMLISFEGGSQQERIFSRAGNRLVVVRATSEERNAGFGASSLTKKTTTLAVA